MQSVAKDWGFFYLFSDVLVGGHLILSMNPDTDGDLGIDTDDPDPDAAYCARLHHPWDCPRYWPAWPLDHWCPLCAAFHGHAHIDLFARDEGTGEDRCTVCGAGHMSDYTHWGCGPGHACPGIMHDGTPGFRNSRWRAFPGDLTPLDHRVVIPAAPCCDCPGHRPWHDSESLTWHLDTVTGPISAVTLDNNGDPKPFGGEITEAFYVLGSAPSATPGDARVIVRAQLEDMSALFTNRITVASTRVVPNFGTVEDSIAGRLAFDSRGWVIPVRQVFRPMRLHTDVLLSGHLILSVTGDLDVIKLWKNTSDPEPLLMSGETITNGVSVVNGQVVNFATLGSTTELWLETLSDGVAEIHYTFIGTGNAEGINFTDTLRITAANITFKPVTTDLLYSGLWEWLLNPSGFEVGGSGGYIIKVEPGHLFLDSEIKWKITEGAGNVSFVYGDTGCSVAVNGDAPGKFKLEVDIGREGDTIWPVPYINGEVFTPSEVPLTIWIVTNATTDVDAEVARVNKFITDANKVFKQSAMTLFIQGGSINFTNKQEWYELDIRNDQFQDMLDLTALSTNTKTLEFYFVDRILADKATPAFHTDYGIVISKDADSRAFAHEIGHACGLDDIYERDDLNGLGLTIFNLPLEENHLPKDWGGGYYPLGMTIDKLIIENLLMYGDISPANAIDIPSGRVYGVWLEQDTSTGVLIKTWKLENVKVGLEDMARSPTSK